MTEIPDSSYCGEGREQPDDSRTCVSAVTFDFSTGFSTDATPSTRQGQLLDASLLLDVDNSNDFDLVGRQEEHQTLKDCWKRVSNQKVDCQSPSELILVNGESGVGKSTLVNSLRPHVFAVEGAFVYGKFDQTSSRSEPFEAIIGAMGDLCDILAMRKDASDIGERLRASFGSGEWEMLSHFIPSELQRLTNKAEDSNNIEKPTFEYSSEPFMRFKRACQTFLKVVSEFCSLVLFLDDTQWADDESMDLLFSLLEDSESSRMLFICAFRSGFEQEVQIPKHTTLRTTIVEMKNLYVHGVTAMVGRLLSASDCTTLGKIVYEKTRGNPFFVNEFLQMMRMEGLIMKNDESGSAEWVWKSEEAIARLDVSEGVASAVESRVYKLRSKYRSVLVVAAHLGFTFRCDLIKKLANMFIPRGNTEDPEIFVDKALSDAEQLALIFHSPKDRNIVSFMHDRVQESLYDMVPDGELKLRMNLSLGRQLLSIETDDKETFLFQTVDHLNLGRRYMTDDGEKLRLVRLNEQASNKAASICSFSSATGYLEVAIEILKQYDMWLEHYDLALKLHCSLARMSCSANDFEKCHGVVGLILSRAKSPLDKQGALHARFSALDMEGRNEEAIQTGLAAMEELGLKIKREPRLSHVLWRLVQVRRLVNQRSFDGLLQLEPTEDKRIIALQELLRLMTMCASMAGLKYLNLLVCIEQMHHSLKYGRTSATPVGTATFGMIESGVLGNHEKGVTLCRLSMKMIEVFGYPEASAAVAFIAPGVILPWRDTLRSTLAPLEAGVENGVLHGETYFVKSNLASLCGVLVHTGKPLEEIEKVLRRNCIQIESFSGGKAVTTWSRCYWQSVLNLLGASDDPLTLTGDAMQEEDALHDPNEPANSVARMTAYFCKFMLACHYRNLDTASAYLTKIEENLPDSTYNLCPANLVPINFFAGLTYIDLARAGHQKRKSLRKAINASKSLQKWTDEGCPYARVLYGVIQGEIAVLRTGKVDFKLYDAGIELAVKEGFPQYAAMCSERAALAHLKETQKYDSFVAEYLKRGLRLNQEWQAHGKAEWYEDLFMSEAVTQSSAKNHPPLRITASGTT